jgi:hypothetical protein
LSDSIVPHHPKHNATSFQLGNQVRLVHGAQVRELAKPMPGHAPPEAVQALIDWAFDVWDHLRDGDYPLARTWAYLQHRVNQMEIFYDGTTNQSILDHKGVPRKGSGTYKDLLNSKRELEKVLGIGPAPRAQMAQQIASSGKDVGLAREAAARLRAKAKVLPPATPLIAPTPGVAPSEDSSTLPNSNSV